MPVHRCFHCHKYLPTAQGLNAHISHLHICYAAYQQLLTHLHIRQYDPEDPDQHPHNDEPQQPDSDVLLNPSQSPDLLDSLPNYGINTSASTGASDMPDTMMTPTVPDGGPLNPSTTLDSTSDTTTTQVFPRPAGKIYGWRPNHFQVLQCALDETGCQPYFPFIDEEEWQLAEILMTNGMSQHQLDRLLKLAIVCAHCKSENLQYTDQHPWTQIQLRMQLSYTDKHSLLRKIAALPCPIPPFQCYNITIMGDELNSSGNPVTEQLELFYWDPVECVRELIGNPAFCNVLHYAPEQIFEDSSCTERIYNEMWSANWWWEIQVSCILASMLTRRLRRHSYRNTYPMVQPLLP